MSALRHRLGLTLVGPHPLTEHEVLALCCRAYERVTPRAALDPPRWPVQTPLALCHNGQTAVRLDRTTVWQANETRSELTIESDDGESCVEISIGYPTHQGFSVLQGGAARLMAVAQGPRLAICERLLQGLLEAARLPPFELDGRWLAL